MFRSHVDACLASAGPPNFVSGLLRQGAARSMTSAGPSRAQTAVVSPASLWSAHAPGHEGKSRAGSQSMTTACGGHRSYRLALAPVRAGAPSRRPARGSLHGELECPPSISASDGRSSHVVVPVSPHRPDNPRQLVGQRDGGLVVPTPAFD